MFRKLFAIGMASAAGFLAMLPASAQFCGFGFGLPFWGPWGSGWGGWGFGWTGIHLFPGWGGCW